MKNYIFSSCLRSINLVMNKVGVYVFLRGSFVSKKQQKNNFRGLKQLKTLMF